MRNAECGIEIALFTRFLIGHCAIPIRAPSSGRCHKHARIVRACYRLILSGPLAPIYSANAPDDAV